MICIDLDNVKYVDALRAAYNLRYAVGGKIFIDRTKKGYHVCSDAEIDPEVGIKIRETIGDDIWRVEISKKRYMIHGLKDYMDIIFRWKNGEEVRRIYEE